MVRYPQFPEDQAFREDEQRQMKISIVNLRETRNEVAAVQKNKIVQAYAIN